MLYFLIDETLANFIKSKQRGPKSKPKGQKSKGSHNGPKEQIKFQSNINSKKHITEGKGREPMCNKPKRTFTSNNGMPPK